METTVRVPDIEEQGPWQERAACKSTDPEGFYPERENKTTTAAAKMICERECQVRLQCLEYALENKEPYGVWGGYSTPERRKLLKKPSRGRAA